MSVKPKTGDHRDYVVGSASIIIGTSRVTLRDMHASDRNAFIAYQLDPRYRKLYDLDEDRSRASELFDLFTAWQGACPRRNFQLGIFDAVSDRLCGCAGLRLSSTQDSAAVLGIELAPSDWGRYRIALDTIACLIEHGFTAMGLSKIVGDTASGNSRVEKMARWFGASIIARRPGPQWMTDRGWHEVDWAISAEEWFRSPRRLLCNKDKTLNNQAPA